MSRPSISDATLPAVSTGPEETMPQGTTMPRTYLQMDQKSLEEAEEKVSEEWNVGDIILDLYEVKEVLGEGGFGKVHRVRHRGWNTDLAVKSLRKDLIRDKVQRKVFIHECEGWVNLGLHPHIVSCYYVRDLGGLPRIFSELMECL
jgi:serine/threonine protein kinase